MKKLNLVSALPWVLFAGLLFANLVYFGYRWQVGSGQVVSATGQVEVKTAPDLYQFNVYYEAKSTDQPATVAEINNKSKEVLAGLTAAGADPAKIKTNISSNPNYGFPESDTNKFATTLNVSIEAADLSAAQKLQDYFVASGAKGTLSPATSFKPETRKKIEFDLREQAAADARKNAEQSARLMGKKLGRVESISDINFGGGPIGYPMFDKMRAVGVLTSGSSEVASAPVTPGEETSSVSISVTYRLR